jgi:hypothetical protein
VDPLAADVAPSDIVRRNGEGARHRPARRALEAQLLAVVASPESRPGVAPSGPSW